MVAETSDTYIKIFLIVTKSHFGVLLCRRSIIKFFLNKVCGRCCGLPNGFIEVSVEMDALFGREANGGYCFVIGRKGIVCVKR